MKQALLAALCGGALTIVGCSMDNESSSSLNDVANPGAPGEANTLFWMVGDQLHRADCAVGSVPTRANCTTDPRHSALVDVTQRSQTAAAAELTAAQTATAQEVAALKDADPTVVALKSEIQSLTTQKTALGRAIAAYDADLTRLQAAKATLDERIAYGDEQLTAVAAALQTKPDDADLLALQAALRSERAANAAALAELILDRDAVTARRAYDVDTLADTTTRLAERQARLERVYAELQVSSERLGTLKAKQTLAEGAAAGIAPVLSMIQTQGVTYRGSLFTQAMRESLRIIGTAIRPAMVLTTGRYEKESGSGNYCPHKVVPNMRDGTLVSAAVTYLSPCSGVSHTYACTAARCTYSSWTMTIIDPTHYSYNGGSGVARFKFIRADAEGQGDEGGPLNAVP